MIVRMLRHGTRVERAMSGNSKSSGRTNPGAYKDKEKPHEVRVSNITAAKGWYSLMIQCCIAVCCRQLLLTFRLLLAGNCFQQQCSLVCGALRLKLS